jgi:hypothetical protein
MEDTAMDDPSQIPDADMTGADLPDTADIAAAAMMDPMDDLFGETAGDLGVPVLAPPLLPAALISRVNDMQRLGCCS